MSDEAHRITTVSKIKLPPIKPVTAEEIRRRRRLFDEAMRLREEIGPIGATTDELVREVREEDLYG